MIPPAAARQRRKSIRKGFDDSSPTDCGVSHDRSRLRGSFLIEALGCRMSLWNKIGTWKSLSFFEAVQVMHVTFLYASLLALLFLGLSVRTLRLRRSLRIAIGDAGNQIMLRAMRVHSNFAEYVPLSLVLIYFVELSGARPIIVHSLGSALLLGRVLHATGVSRVNERYAFRVAGMALTFTVLGVTAARLLLDFASTVRT